MALRRRDLAPLLVSTYVSLYVCGRVNTSQFSARLSAAQLRFKTGYLDGPELINRIVLPTAECSEFGSRLRCTRH